MKKRMMTCLLALTAIFAFAFVSCKTNDDDDKGGNGNGAGVPAVYNGFYNYPTGRVDATGTLKITNNAAMEVLLFDGTVSADKYLGTVGSLGSVLLKLPDEKFYSIVSVAKSTYEEKASQAAQLSYYTYYSNTQGYSVNVSTSATSGAGTWLINNPTNYWVEFKTSDEKQNLAVVAPRATRVAVPIEINKAIDFHVYFKKEISFNGRILSSVDTTDVNLYDTAVANADNSYVFSTTIGANGLNPSTNIKPSVLIKNNMQRGTVYCKKSNTYLSNGASAVDNLPVPAGQTQLYSGLVAEDALNTINFENQAWLSSGKGNLWLNSDVKMENGKVYIIELTGNADGSGGEVALKSVEDANDYFEKNK